MGEHATFQDLACFTYANSAFHIAALTLLTSGGQATFWGVSLEYPMSADTTYPTLARSTSMFSANTAGSGLSVLPGLHLQIYDGCRARPGHRRRVRDTGRHFPGDVSLYVHGLTKTFYGRLSVVVGELVRPCGARAPVVIGMLSLSPGLVIQHFTNFMGSVPGSLLGKVDCGYTEAFPLANSKSRKRWRELLNRANLPQRA